MKSTDGRESEKLAPESFEHAQEIVQARLAAIVESSDDAILSKTLDGAIQTWNLGAQNLFGYTAAEAVGRHITLIIPEERYDEEREIIARIAAGERVEHFETIRVTKDGSRIHISLTVSPIRDASGRIVGASKVARDIGERIRIEAALRDADARKDEFIALLAHELRNPLAPLRNGLRMMRIAGGDAETIAGARAMMERQLGHMVRLVDDLLDISRINQRKMELRRELITLRDVVNAAVETARPVIDAGGHSLTVSLPPETAILNADLTRLAQVFSNLLTNSAKYTARGGSISLEATVGDGSATLMVRDSGIGIPADAMARVFDMFSQVDRNIERASGGLGIGLALVKGLVEMHGGTVSVASDGQGKGSLFTVVLPLAELGLRPPVDEAEDAVTIPVQRILVVDDNRDSARSLTELLRLVGHVVQEAHDGEEAIIQAELFRPDVILMDIGMPKLSGYAATQRIRDYEWAKDIFIVALTGWGHSTDREHSRNAGCNAHLVKPVTLEELNKFLADRHRGGALKKST